jgi:UDP-N-acetyl-D-mannosaminuronate dehydrogenase
VGDEVIRNTTVLFTSDAAKLREAKFHIVAVPTAINQDNTPDLTPVIKASEILGRNLVKGSIVVLNPRSIRVSRGRMPANPGEGIGTEVRRRF